MVLTLVAWIRICLFVYHINQQKLLNENEIATSPFKKCFQTHLSQQMHEVDRDNIINRTSPLKSHQQNCKCFNKLFQPGLSKYFAKFEFFCTDYQNVLLKMTFQSAILLVFVTFSWMLGACAAIKFLQSSLLSFIFFLFLSFTGVQSIYLLQTFQSCVTFMKQGIKRTMSKNFLVAAISEYVENNNIPGMTKNSLERLEDSTPSEVHDSSQMLNDENNGRLLNSPKSLCEGSVFERSFASSVSLKFHQNVHESLKNNSKYSKTQTKYKSFRNELNPKNRCNEDLNENKDEFLKMDSKSITSQYLSRHISFPKNSFTLQSSSSLSLSIDDEENHNDNYGPHPSLNSLYNGEEEDRIFP